jgi:CobQ-like glutamine amidotransferase family enzyme
LAWRGIASEVVTVRSGQSVPVGCELYVVGGGEDLPQALAAQQLGPLSRAVDGGAAVLAVCAGMQIIGTTFVGPDGQHVAGAGVVDCQTGPGPGRRLVGELVVDPDPRLGLPALTGYENHGSVTTVGGGARSLGRVVHGVGNGDGSGADGVWSGRIIGTYMHGPVLARNPALADHLLSSVVGELAPLDDAEPWELRRERMAAATGSRRFRRGARRWP